MKQKKNWLKNQVVEFSKALVIIFVIRTFLFGLYQVPTCSMETTMLVGERFFADKLTIYFKPPRHGDIISFNDPCFAYSTNPMKRLFENYVWGPSNWTKRVIGIPGDHIKGILEDGKPVIYRNGEKIEEPYVNKYPIIGVYKSDSMPPWTFKTYDPNYDYANQPFYTMNEFDVLRAKRIMEQFDQTWMRMPNTPVIYDGRTVDEYDIQLGKNQYWVLGDNRQGSSDSRIWGPLDGSLIHGRIVWRLLSIDSNESWLALDILKNPISFWKKVRWNRNLQPVY